MATAAGLIAMLPAGLGAVAAPALLGAGAVSCLGLLPRHGWRLFAAWSYLTGHFLQAWFTFAWVAAGQPVPGWLLPVLAAGLGVVLANVARRRACGMPGAGERGDPWVRAATVALVLLLVERCSVTSLHAIVGSDEANIWSAKARVLYAGGDLRGWLGTGYVQHADYPLLDPLAQVLAFASSGRVLWWENRLPLQGFGIALLLLLSVVVERRVGRWLAIAMLAAFTSTSFVHFAPTVYADVLLAFTLLATLDAWLRFRATADPSWWRLGCVAAAAMLATKNEGAMLALAVAGAAAATRCVTRGPLLPRLGGRLGWLLVPLVTVGAGQGWNACYGLANDLTAPGAGDGRGLFGRMLSWLPERAGPVAQHYGGLLLDGDATRWLVLAMLLAPLATGRGALRAGRVWPWLVVVFGACGYMLVFVGTTADAGGPGGPARGLLWHLATAADRTLLHLLPTAVLAACAYLGRDGEDAGSAGVAIR